MKPALTKTGHSTNWNHLEKGNFSNKMMIPEKACIVSDDRRLCEIVNTRFLNITKTVDLKLSMISTNKSIFEIIKTFKDHQEKFFFKKGGVSVQVSFCK